MPLVSLRQDAWLEKVSQNTGSFCLALLAPLPIWGIVEIFGHLFSKLKMDGVTEGSWIVLAILNAFYFARLAWHRYSYPDMELRKKQVFKFGALGFFASFIFPVIIVTLVVAVGSATAPKRLPPEQDRIEP